MIDLDIDQRIPEWYEARKGIPTSSEFYKVITPKTGQLAAQHSLYIAELIAETMLEPVEQFDNQWMQRGRELEDEAAAWYAFHYKRELTPGGMFLLDDRSAGASPDRRVGDNGLLEIKCLKPSHHIMHLLASTVPAEFVPQLHGALHVSEREWIDLCLYCPGVSALVLRVVPNDYTAKLALALRTFTNELNTAKAKIMGIDNG